MGSAPINVANELTIAIPAGTAGGVHPFPQAAAVRVGTTIKFLNADGSAHRIHSGNEDAGFAHQAGELDPGQEYSATFTAAGEFNYYCHIHEASTGIGSFVVAAP